MKESGLDTLVDLYWSQFLGVSAKYLSATVGDPGIITRPDSRGRGYATAAASRVVENATGLGRLVLYQTLESNTAAVSVATRLGFEQYATHVAVRLLDRRSEDDFTS